MDEEQGLIANLRRYWLALAVVAILVATVAVVMQRRSHPSGGTEPGEAPVAESAGSKGEAKTAEKSDAPANSATDNAVASVMSQTVTVDARPAAVLKGQGKWDEAAKTISAALAKVHDAASRAGLAVNGRPVAVFTKTDDAGFTFEAMAPLAAAPEGKVKLADGVEIGASPAGRALKFQHRGAYDEIDATYEAIAAFLDEKGLDTKDLIIEEYLTDFKGDDANVDVDIYVFLR